VTRNKHKFYASKLITGALALSAAQPVFAYLDPGTGSMIIQGLIAGIAMVGVTARMYWHKLQTFLGRAPDHALSRSADTEADDADTGST